jgi:hypothetical protein
MKDEERGKGIKIKENDGRMGEMEEGRKDTGNR